MSRAGNRPPGRPAAADREGQAARATLIATGARLFAEQGFEATSLRQVAEGANVTPAMVAYYFKDKSGLLEAVVRDGLEIMLGVIRSAVDDDAEGEFTSRLIGRYIKTISRMPWIPQIMIREVISKDTPLRKVFTEEFAVHAASLVPAKVAAEMQKGLLRADLDPRYAILSLVGMCFFPFIAHPVLGPLLNYDLDDEFGEAYGAHAADLFKRGAGARE